MATNLGHIEAVLGLNTTRFTRSINKVQAKLEGVSRKMQATGRAMTMALTLPLGILGGTAVKTFADFEAAMNQVKAVSQATEKQMAQLEDTARDLGSTTKFTATQAAEGMNFLAMAGFEVNEVIASMPATLNLAAAGNMELGRAADHVSNIMQAFGIEASKTSAVTDVLTKTFTSSNTSLEQLGEAMSYAAPAASALDQEITTVSAALGMLSDAGIQSSRAGTGLRQIFTQLIKKQGEMGISIQNAFGEFYDLADILEQVEERGLTAAEVFDIMGPRAGTAMVTLMKRGSAELRQFSEEVGNAGGLAQRVADTQMEGLKGAFIELKSAVQEVMISFSETFAGALEGLVDKIKVGTQWLGNLDDRTKRIALAVAGLVAAIGPAIFILGKLAIVIGGLMSPVTAIVAGLVALGVGVLYIVDNWAALKERMGNWSWWKNALIQALQWLIEWNPTSMLMKGWNEFMKLIGKENLQVPNPFEKLSDGLEGMKDDIPPFQHKFENFFDFIKRRSKDAGDLLASLIPSGGGGGGLANPERMSAGRMRGKGSQIGFTYGSPGGFGTGAQDTNPLIEHAKNLERLARVAADTANKHTAAMGEMTLGTAILSNAFQGMNNVISDSLNSTSNILQSFWTFFVNWIKGMIIKLAAAAIAASLLATALSALGIPTGFMGLASGAGFGDIFKAGFGQLVGMRSGGFVTEGGLFKVGEAGPEIVSLPAGSAVTPTRGGDSARDKLVGALRLRRLLIEQDRERNRLNG